MSGLNQTVQVALSPLQQANCEEGRVVDHGTAGLVAVWVKTGFSRATGKQTAVVICGFAE
jgi:hypothetical protein